MVSKFVLHHVPFSPVVLCQRGVYRCSKCFRKIILPLFFIEYEFSNSEKEKIIVILLVIGKLIILLIFVLEKKVLIL